MVTPYYPEAQGMVERGHKEIKEALTKMCGEDGGKWKECLPLVTFADRISTKRTTGYSPFELQYGQPAILPIDLELQSFLVGNWEEVKTTAELLQARSEQLSNKEEMMETAYQKMKTARETSVKYWDRRLAHRMRKPLEPGDMVLVYNKSLESQWGSLFKNRWNGPYRVKGQVNSGPYILEELDGTELNRRYAASHVKKFYPRGKVIQDHTTAEEEDDEEGEEQAAETEEGNQ